MRNEKAMEAISYGLFILAAQQDGRDNGSIINTVLQATTQPNRVLFTANKKSLTHDMVLQTGKFVLSVLSEGAPMALFERFGLQSGREADKFAGFDSARRADNGVYYVTQGVNAWISGTVSSTVDLGSHTLFVADVTDGDVLSPEPSATYAYYHTHIKPPPAVTPAAGEAGGKKRWVCKVCGYVYEGDELPADIICPWCGHPASDFEPLP